MYVWDPQKNKKNQEKHGISFEEARDSIFEGKNLWATGIAYFKNENRHALIGKHMGKYYVALFTITDIGVRIISVRRARNEEEKQAKARGL